MRPFDLRSRSLRTAAAALVSSTSLTAVALAAAPPDRADAPVPMKLERAHVRYGERLRASGRLTPADAGRPLALELRASGATWTAARTATVSRDGAYALSARPRASGEARVVLTDHAAPHAAAAGDAHAITVGARIATHERSIHVLSGRSAALRGSVQPGRGGRAVILQARRSGHWRTIEQARTRGHGRFAFALRPARLGSTPLRMRFGGDRGNGAAIRRAGTLNVYRATTASWYQLSGGALACGGRMTGATLGVANRSLPCGTRVTIRYRGRTVRVRVLDRGPFVSGREWDLSGATARALHFGGVGTVWTTR